MAGNEVNEWRRVASVAEFSDTDMYQVDIDGHVVALFKVDGEYYATDDVCTHAYANLTFGYLEGDIIERPLHQGTFNVCTGKALSAPVVEDLRTYPVKLEGDDILVAYSPPEPAPPKA